MTNSNSNSNARPSFRGTRDDGVAVSEVCGVLGGVLGGVLALSGGSSKMAAIGGAVAGAAGGYAMGNMLSPISNLNTSTKILTGIASGCFGISVAGLGSAIVDGLGALGKDQA